MQCKTTIILALYSITFCSGEDFGEPVNVALNRVCNQSSTYNRYGENFSAENAVDGNSGTCFNTYNESAPWWSVDLGKVLPVLKITIYLRPNYFGRIENSEILLDGHLCATIGKGLRENPIKIQCINRMYGQILMIIKQGRDYLNFCDFQVWVPQFLSVCSAGKYGSNCKSNCSQNCDGGPDFSVCHSDSGLCYACPPNRYGSTCDSVCSTNCAPSPTDPRTCDVKSGSCLNGCPAGKFGEMCEKNCVSMNCLKNKCHQETGQCMLCNGNYAPPACTECKDMTFGVNCSKACGKCRGGEPCNSVSGVCTKGCNPGWLPPEMCNTKCDLGYYGDGCNQTCGYCRFITQCRHDNGFCTAGCAASFQGDLCIDAKTSDGLLAGSILGGFVIIAASILIAILLVNRSRNRQASATIPSSVRLSELQERTEEISAHSPHAVQQIVNYEERENTNSYDRLDPNAQNEISTYTPLVFKEIGNVSQKDERIYVNDEICS